MALCSDPACDNRATYHVVVIRPDPEGGRRLGRTATPYCEEHAKIIFLDIEKKRLNEGQGWNVKLEQIIYPQSPSPERR